MTKEKAAGQVRVFLKDGKLLKTMDWKKCVQRPAGTEPVSVATEVGAKMADGSVFAGLTADGRQQIYAMPDDLDVCMSFNDAAKAVTELNNNKALGHDDWHIPSVEHLRVLYTNHNEGALKGTFNDYCSNTDAWYWSSTEDRGDSSFVWDVRFLDGYEVWNLKDGLRLSCRPVRLVDAKRF